MLFLDAFVGKVQFHVALLGFAKGAHLPRFRAYVRVAAFATNPKYGVFALIKRARAHRVVQVLEEYLMPFFHRRDKRIERSNVFKAFFFRDFGELFS